MSVHMYRLSLATTLACVYVGAASAQPSTDTLGARLHAARSLRCDFTAETSSVWRKGQWTVKTEKLDGQAAANQVVYDNINIRNGTARAVGNAGASDLAVKVDGLGAIWFTERVPIGFLVMTTVIPIYAAGTNDFLVVESRHSWLDYALATQDSGTCAVLD